MTRSYWTQLVLGLAVLVGPALLVGCEGGEGPPATPPTNPMPAGTAPGGPKDVAKEKAVTPPAETPPKDKEAPK